MDVEEFLRLVDTSINNIDITEDSNVNTLADLAIDMIIKCLDTVAPNRKIKLQNKWLGKQWFSDEIRQILRQRDKAYETARISKSNADWELFRQFRNRGVGACRKAKRSYLENKLDKNKKNPKRMWGSLKELLKGSSFRDNVYKEIRCGDKIIKDINEMANMFNRYFIDSISAFKENDLRMEIVRDVRYTESVFEVFSLIEVESLNRIVYKLANNRHRGRDNSRNNETGSKGCR